MEPLRASSSVQKQSTRPSLRMKRGTLLASEIKDSIDKKFSVAEPELHLAMQYVRNQIPLTVPVRPGGDLHRMFQFYDQKRTGTISGKVSPTNDKAIKVVHSNIKNGKCLGC